MRLIVRIKKPTSIDKTGLVKENNAISLVTAKK
jgi:hypothetical protein